MPESSSGSAVIHMILFFRDERIVRQIPWDWGLASATTYARDYLAIRKANRVEVRDGQGATVFHFAPPEPGDGAKPDELQDPLKLNATKGSIT